MKGKILGFDVTAANGVITGEDGKRYKFGSAEWKAPRQPRQGEDVDYEISSDGMAAEIYPLKASAGLDLGDMGARMKDALGGGNVDLGDVGAKAKQMFATGSNSPAGERAVTLLTTRLPVSVSILILVVSLFFTFLSWSSAQVPFLPSVSSGGHSIMGIGDFADEAGTVVNTIDKQAKSEIESTQQTINNYRTSPFFANSDTSHMQAQIGKNQDLRGEATIAGLLVDLLYVLYLIPIGAAFVLLREWQGRPMALASLAVGGLCVFGFLLAYATKVALTGLMVDSMGGLINEMAEATGAKFGARTAFGTWAILILGVLLILNTFGIVRLSGQQRQLQRA